MPELKSSLLVGTAISTAVLHTLIPDHWLPFVLIGRARNWSLRHTAILSSLSTLIGPAPGRRSGPSACGSPPGTSWRSS